MPLTYRGSRRCQEGNNDLFPTVYLLWAFPKALESLLTYSEVSPKLLGGADLMLQGLITPEAGLGEWEEGDARCVTLPDNHFPFAVGSMAVSSASLAKTGLKGRGLKLLHHFPDTCVRLRSRGSAPSHNSRPRLQALAKWRPVHTRRELYAGARFPDRRDAAGRRHTRIRRSASASGCACCRGGRGCCCAVPCT